MLLAGGEQDQGCLPPVVIKIPSSGLLPGLAIPLLPGRFLRDAPPEVHACCRHVVYKAVRAAFTPAFKCIVCFPQR